jgi:hypothetical protein
LCGPRIYILGIPCPTSYEKKQYPMNTGIQYIFASYQPKSVFYPISIPDWFETFKKYIQYQFQPGIEKKRKTDAKISSIK